MIHRDKSIRERAYEIWESEGRPEGREAQHWEQARAELASLTGAGEANQAPEAVSKAGAKPRGSTKSAAAAKPGAKAGSKSEGKGGVSAVDRGVAVLREDPKAEKPKPKRKPGKT
ncbi:hypothetical protein LL06_12450 [Hoeflea sp. BAL378]|uniref:DUF2934 domain-containing protein n=1 Tax=Hoeflea sp. BAL378 TaxID=1547437 RepID=UPI000513FEFC|nr:DUF2934 domain-containing protein [Hoeflea sp. BAL378]KGF69183.1 hypothetical protein LL06_12450 [Hoeflea sp. BAL378]